MSETVLKVENVSKQYRLGEVGTGTLSHDLKRWWYLKRGKEDPYLKIGEENRRDVAGGDYVWALQNINFEVKQGEVLGIIGKNGAGKSTLLKLLSRVTAPTTGQIKAKGRIASLLEVGTGMHPDLTGRENVYLNGAILGMTKAEIASKFDEIVSFSGCDKYVDTPVKRYSSGMKVRLGFAVAAFLEPEILIVDEVLAVGDAEFQKKAIGKMQDVAKGGGRTVLFVSHNMESVKNLCTRGIVVVNGLIGFDGDVDESVDFHLQSGMSSEMKLEHNFIPEIGSVANIRNVKIINPNQKYSIFKNTDPIKFNIETEILESISNLSIGIQVKTFDDKMIFVSFDKDLNDIGISNFVGIKNIEFTIPEIFLNTGTCKCVFILIEPNKEVLFRTEEIGFEINTIDSGHRKVLTKRRGDILTNFTWNKIP